ncbi:hypothetical protein [Nocardia panacis]|nr:hypothetical protein [Nocardia panacis]
MSIWLTGADGSIWDLDGDQGVELRPGPKRIIDAPAKTFWIAGAANMHYQGRQFERRDPTFAVNIFATDGNPDTWRDIDSQFRRALGMYDQQFTLHIETDDGVRHLDLRLLSEPTAYENGSWEGKNPHLYATSTLLINAAAEQPFWYADDFTFTWTTATGSGSTTFRAQNLGDIEVWPKYFVNAPGTWTLPDYSWGQEGAYQRPANIDTARTVTLPALVAGEDCAIDSDPDQEALVAANGSPIWARWNGNSLLYPIAAGTKPTAVPISVTGANANAAVTVRIPRRYSRPFGVSL